MEPKEPKPSRRGGLVLAQDEATSVIFGMAREAIKAGVGRSGAWNATTLRGESKKRVPAFAVGSGGVR